LLGLRLHQRDTGEYQRECQSYFVQHDPSPCVEPPAALARPDRETRQLFPRRNSTARCAHQVFVCDGRHKNAQTSAGTTCHNAPFGRYATSRPAIEAAVSNVLTPSIRRRHHGHVGRGGRTDVSADPSRTNPTTGIGCCARATTGHVAAPPTSDMNSRRFTRSPRRRVPAAYPARLGPAPWRS
jgi:hypothetical protein